PPPRAAQIDVDTLTARRLAARSRHRRAVCALGPAGRQADRRGRRRDEGPATIGLLRPARRTRPAVPPFAARPAPGGSPGLARAEGRGIAVTSKKGGKR